MRSRRRTSRSSRRPKRAFLPEFLNRIGRIAERLHEQRGIELTVAAELTARLARDGFDPEFGAWPLKRHIRRTLEKELTRAILDGRLDEGSRVMAREGDGRAVVLEVEVPVAE